MQQAAMPRLGPKSSIVIRMQRWGAKGKPFYRIVACHRWAPRDGKFLEILGTYNPIPDPFGNKQVTLKVDKVKKWIMHGAEPSDRVAKLLGLAEILPPPPRRYLPKEILSVPPSSDPAAAEDDDEMLVEEGEAEAGTDEGMDVAASEVKE